MRCATSCATMRWRRWPTGDAVLVIDETGFLKQGKASCGVGAAVHRLGGQDHQLPDRRLRRLCVAARPCLHRPGAVSAEGLDGRSGPPGRGACAAEDAASRPSRACAGDDRAGDRGRACRSPGWRPTASTAWARSRWRCAGPARAMCWASTPTTASTPGAASRRSPARPRRSRRPRPARPGSACRRAREPRGRGCTTGPISNWPISTPPNTTTAAPGLWTRGLLIRRNIADGELAFFTTWCPAGTPIETLVEVEGQRWAIEDSFETAKNELGLDHNETRSWHGWHRHVSLVMLAFAMLAAIRHRANAPHPQKPRSG